MICIKIPLLALLFQGIPEQIAVTMLAFSIAQISFNLKKVLTISIIMAFSAYLARLSQITFEIHTILLVIIFILILLIVENVDLSLAFLSSLLSFLALAVFEYVVLSTLMPIFKLTPETVLSNLTIRILVGEPQVILMILVALIIRQIRKRGKIYEFFGKCKS
ncbi:hypothetical protein [Candidatus Desulfosporosinus nitrosoreducens]|uniref:hypothetical protein n=1 Tax=Candidatus Desulfosporosinus nitrosoreducens TaxID=3401928 RepID=UPI00280BD020|nr:hypothetical protein [Desulfosporosinus sp. PR]